MGKSILAANWKMNINLDDVPVFMTKFLDLVNEMGDDREALIIPTDICLSKTKQSIGDSKVSLGGQNMHHKESGAYTGEVSGPMLVNAGCKYVVVGHSERREYFGETNLSCNKKIKGALDCGLIPIYCIGETLKQREARITLPLVEIQVREGLAGLSNEQAASIVIAYEPVWAIGTGKTATAEQAQEVHQSIRGILKKIFDGKTSKSIRIQYGGSVKPGNVDELMAMPDIDGALVGGASLDPESFARIVLYQNRQS